MCAFLHAHEAEGFPRFGLLWVKTLAVVAHLQQYVPFLLRQQESDHRGVGMLNNVVQRLLRDTIERMFFLKGASGLRAERCCHIQFVVLAYDHHAFL